MGKALAPGF